MCKWSKIWGYRPNPNYYGAAPRPLYTDASDWNSWRRLYTGHENITFQQLSHHISQVTDSGVSTSVDAAVCTLSYLVDTAECHDRRRHWVDVLPGRIANKDGASAVDVLVTEHAVEINTTGAWPLHASLFHFYCRIRFSGSDVVIVSWVTACQNEIPLERKPYLFS